MENHGHSKRDLHTICARMSVYQTKPVTFLLTLQKDLDQLQGASFTSLCKNINGVSKMTLLIQLKGSCTLIFDQEAVLKRSQSHKAVRVWIW